MPAALHVLADEGVMENIEPVSHAARNHVQRGRQQQPGNRLPLREGTIPATSALLGVLSVASGTARGMLRRDASVFVSS